MATDDFTEMKALLAVWGLGEYAASFEGKNNFILLILFFLYYTFNPKLYM